MPKEFLPVNRQEMTLRPAWAPTASPSAPGVVSLPQRVRDPALRKVWREVQPVIELMAPRHRGWQDIVKRLIDIVGSGLGLIVLSPLFAIVAAFIRAECPGPVIFSQNRVGRGGRLFQILKFRTMVHDAEERRDALLSQSLYTDLRLFKISNDPRLTRLGRFLRRTSLDELPQLVNVLRGEMSLVGPRPPMPSEVVLYEQRHYGRFEVKPGLTGPWQVAGRNDIKDFEQVVQLERDYIRNWSLTRDVTILFLTIPAVFTGRGAL